VPRQPLPARARRRAGHGRKRTRRDLALGPDGDAAQHIGVGVDEPQLAGVPPQCRADRAKQPGRGLRQRAGGGDHAADRGQNIPSALAARPLGDVAPDCYLQRAAAVIADRRAAALDLDPGAIAAADARAERLAAVGKRAPHPVAVIGVNQLQRAPPDKLTARIPQHGLM